MKNSFLPQFQEEENELFDKNFVDDQTERWARIISDSDDFEQIKIVKDFLSSSHSRLIDKIVEMVEGEKHNCSNPMCEICGSLECPIDRALSLIQSKLKQI